MDAVPQKAQGNTVLGDPSHRHGAGESLQVLPRVQCLHSERHERWRECVGALPLRNFEEHNNIVCIFDVELKDQLLISVFVYSRKEVWSVP